MKKYTVRVFFDDGIPWSHDYQCDENTLEVTLRVARETKNMTSIDIIERK